MRSSRCLVPCVCCSKTERGRKLLALTALAYSESDSRLPIGATAGSGIPREWATNYRTASSASGGLLCCTGAAVSLNAPRPG